MLTFTCEIFIILFRNVNLLEDLSKFVKSWQSVLKVCVFSLLRMSESKLCVNSAINLQLLWFYLQEELKLIILSKALPNLTIML